MKKYNEQDHDWFRNWAFHQHNIECNQKYSNLQLPYSTHLHFVDCAVKRFSYLLTEDEVWLVRMGAIGHDLIEDARLTYNDIKQKWGEPLADIIFACTEMRGRNRDERHNEEYYKHLAQNRLAVFVKLCDIIANVQFGLMENSSMVLKYQKEYDKGTKYYLFKSEFIDIFRYLESLFALETQIVMNKNLKSKV